MCVLEILVSFPLSSEAPISVLLSFGCEFACCLSSGGRRFISYELKTDFLTEASHTTHPALYHCICLLHDRVSIIILRHMMHRVSLRHMMHLAFILHLALVLLISLSLSLFNLPFCRLIAQPCTDHVCEGRACAFFYDIVSLAWQVMQNLFS